MNTLFTGRHIIKLNEVVSTNTYAMQALREGNLTEGTLIVTHSQTGGRGQFGNSWEAEAGKNLTFSLVIHPHFLPTEKQFYLSKITSLAVFGALTEYLPSSQYDIKIKWPNDVLVNGQKIAGILIENVLQQGYLQSSVIGVGINVNQLIFKQTGARQPVSLAILTGAEQELDLLLAHFCRQFEALYLSLKSDRLEMINRQYMLNLYRFGQPALYASASHQFEGVIEGLEESGKLVLRTPQGARSFGFKEVTFL